MALILVAPRAEADRLSERHRPSHRIDIASPEAGASALSAGEETRGPSRSRLLRLSFHDIDEPRPGLVAPAPEHLAALLAFAAGWHGSRPLLVTCELGISRSPAAALALACGLRPDRPEAAWAGALRAAAPCCTPNRRIAALADAALGRGGRLLSAARAIGRGADYVPQAGFGLDLDPSAGC